MTLNWILVFHLILRKSKSPQVSRIRSILSDFTVVLSILPLISNFFTLVFKPVPSTPNTISITVTLMFHIFLVLWQSTSICLFFCFLLFLLCGQLERQNPSFFFISFNFFFLFDNKVWSSGWNQGIRLYLNPFVSKSKWILYVSFSGTDSGLCLNHSVM